MVARRRDQPAPEGLWLADPLSLLALLGANLLFVRRPG